MEVHVHLKNTFPDGIGNRMIPFDYNLWFASHPSSHSSYSVKVNALKKEQAPATYSESNFLERIP